MLRYFLSTCILRRCEHPRQYDEVRARVLIYDKHLEELETLYKEKENEDISPTIVEEEDKDGKIIDI